MRKLHTAVRIGALGALFVLICAVYLVILVNVQITGQDYYDIIKEETTTRYVKIAAKRGEIYDTNGKALVINTQIYDISLEYGAMPKKADAFNAVILDVLSAIKESGGVYTPVEVTFPFTGSFPNYEKDEEFFKSATNKTSAFTISCTLFLKLFIPCTHFIISAAFRLSVKPSCTAICFIRVSSSFIAVCSTSAKCSVRVQLVRRL